MKIVIPKGSTSRILTVFIQANNVTTGAGLGSLIHTSSIVGGYVREGGTGVALAVDEDVTTEGTYQAPSAVGKVRIGTPANMRTGTYELHFHNDLWATGAEAVTITLGGAANMADLTIEVQLSDPVRGLGAPTALPNAAADAAGGLPISDAGGLDLDAKIGALTFTVAGDVDVNVQTWGGTAISTPPAVNASQFGGAAVTATTSVTIPAASTLATTTGAVGSVTGAVGSVTGAVGSVTGAVGSVTGNVGGNVTGNVTGSVGSVATGGIAATSFAAGAINAAAIANAAIDAATFAADVDAEFLSYIVDDATRIDASSLNTASVTSIPAILADTGTDGVVVAAGSKTGYTLTATTGLGNQTANLTGNLSGSVGSVTTGVNVAQWLGTAVATPTVAGVPEVDITHINGSVATGVGTPDVNVVSISGDTVAADNAEAFFDGTGYAGTNNVIPTVTTLTNLPAITSGWITATGIAPDAIGADEISAAAAAKVADIVLRRTQTNVEASSFGDAVSLGCLYGLIQQAQESNTTATPGTLTVFKVDGSTSLGTRALTTNAAADPVDGIS